MPERARRAELYQGGWTVVRPDWRTALQRERPLSDRVRSAARRSREFGSAAGAGSRSLIRRMRNRNWRDDFETLWPRLRGWLYQHRILVVGMLVVALFAAADTVAPRTIDRVPAPGTAQRIAVAYPLQVQAEQETSKRYLKAIDNGERLREAQVVAAAQQSTLDRAKAEAAAAVSGAPQPWLPGRPEAIPGGVFPGGIAPGIGGFALPAVGAFTSGYGSRWGTFHRGIDIAAPIGSPIYAVADGVVIDAGPAQGFGLWVRIRHNDGSISVYGHMYDFSVSVGERVHAGQQIARIGNRGDSTGPHLHFEVLVSGQHIDPQPWLALHGVQVG
ncbi:M23 family metallopeptidase [Nocardia vermiculata]|uniref:M23 family metallopeptidase n=1 Tax=Nocardia vermiculata TaxID=257274 RepID=A0A846Y8U7_9NOCA|nr:M23 family metallopeptidase [Nocardia vermiculata]NKY53169.1 M23 family metallopeptidase [Nocardia vermiculata]